jgi:hypothetical protein
MRWLIADHAELRKQLPKALADPDIPMRWHGKGHEWLKLTKGADYAWADRWNAEATKRWAGVRLKVCGPVLMPASPESAWHDWVWSTDGWHQREHARKVDAHRTEWRKIIGRPVTPPGGLRFVELYPGAVAEADERIIGDDWSLPYTIGCGAPASAATSMRRCLPTTLATNGMRACASESPAKILSKPIASISSN